MGSPVPDPERSIRGQVVIWKVVVRYTSRGVQKCDREAKVEIKGVIKQVLTVGKWYLIPWGPLRNGV